MATLVKALSEFESRKIIERKHGAGIFVSENINQKTISLIFDLHFLEQSSASPFWQLLILRSQKKNEAKNESFSFYQLVSYGGGSGLIYETLRNDIKYGRVDGIIVISSEQPETFQEQGY